MNCCNLYFQINTAVASRRLIGKIEDVTFDNVAVGLWDFVQGEHNPDGCMRRYGGCTS